MHAADQCVSQYLGVVHCYGTVLAMRKCVGVVLLGNQALGAWGPVILPPPVLSHLCILGLSMETPACGGCYATGRNAMGNGYASDNCEPGFGPFLHRVNVL